MPSLVVHAGPSVPPLNARLLFFFPDNSSPTCTPPVTTRTATTVAVDEVAIGASSTSATTSHAACSASRLATPCTTTVVDRGSTAPSVLVSAKRGRPSSIPSVVASAHAGKRRRVSIQRARPTGQPPSTSAVPVGSRSSSRHVAASGSTPPVMAQFPYNPVSSGASPTIESLRAHPVSLFRDEDGANAGVRLNDEPQRTPPTGCQAMPVATLDTVSGLSNGSFHTGTDVGAPGPVGQRNGRPMFTTGSGRVQTVSAAARAKAASLMRTVDSSDNSEPTPPYHNDGAGQVTRVLRGVRPHGGTPAGRLEAVGATPGVRSQSSGVAPQPSSLAGAGPPGASVAKRPRVHVRGRSVPPGRGRGMGRRKLPFHSPRPAARKRRPPEPTPKGPPAADTPSPAPGKRQRGSPHPRASGPVVSCPPRQDQASCGGVGTVSLQEFAAVHGLPHVAPTTALPRRIRDMSSRNAMLTLFSSSSKLPCGENVTSWWPVGVAWYHESLVAAGCNPKLCSTSWVANHFRWIVWKLACMERAYPSLLAGKCLTTDRVMAQLRHRYQREHKVCADARLGRLGCYKQLVCVCVCVCVCMCARARAFVSMCMRASVFQP